MGIDAYVWWFILTRNYYISTEICPPQTKNPSTTPACDHTLLEPKNFDFS